MHTCQSDFLHILSTRGFIHQCTGPEDLDARCRKEKLTGYTGFDATAPSLHAGSLIQIMLLYWLQQSGHRPLVLMGGGTTRIGDPSGKDTQRSLLTEKEINANIESIKSVFSNFLTFGDGETDAVMLDNDAWLSRLGYIDFLREFGVHFTINRMMTFDSVRLRLERESPMSFLEFNYLLMQAYDFYELHRRFGCTLQLGGSDQWGNIINGVELCRRKAGTEVFGLTTPLLTTASGKKMGKTENGAVWLNADMYSPYEYWQFWRNTEDADVGRMLALFTTLPMDEVERLGALKGAEINESKKILATHATAMLHGNDNAQRAEKTAQETFEGGRTGTELPSVNITAAGISAGTPLIEPFLSAGLVASKGEARRHIRAGALKINDNPVTEERNLDMNDLAGGSAKLSVGRKRHAVIRIV